MALMFWGGQPLLAAPPPHHLDVNARFLPSPFRKWCRFARSIVPWQRENVGVTSAGWLVP